MYRDEKEALKARRESLKRETVEVDARLKAIDDLNRMKPIAPRWQRVCVIGACLMILISFASMWGMIIFDTPPHPELAPDPDASVCEEHGPSIPQSSEEAVQTLENMAAACDVTDNNCNTEDNGSFNIVFLFDTSPSMEAHLGYLKEAVIGYARETSATYTLAETLPGTGYGRMAEYGDRERFISAVSRIGVNPRVDKESIPLLLDEWTISRTNLGGRALVFAFTDEGPQIPADFYYQVYGNGFRPMNFCSPKYNHVAFTVFTTPEHTRAWRELGSCIRVYGDF